MTCESSNEKQYDVDSASAAIDVNGLNRLVISNNNVGEELETLPVTESNSMLLKPVGNNSEVYMMDRLTKQDQDSKENWLQRHYNAENHVLNLMVSV